MGHSAQSGFRLTARFRACACSWFVRLEHGMCCVHVLLLVGLIELSVNPDALWVTDSGSRLLYSVFL